MNEKETKRISKFLSLVLRHNPDKIGLVLDENAWANTSDLIQKCNKHRIKFTLTELEEVVETNNKKRFSFNADKSKIRANQGHSLKNVNLDFIAIEPPQFLFHGTVDKFMASIREKGLQKMSRQHVHLSKDRETAINVGSRRGKPVILSVRALEMHQAGFGFYFSANGVWLTDNVPAKYLNYKNNSCPNCSVINDYTIENQFMKKKLIDKSEKYIYKLNCKNCGEKLILEKFTKNNPNYSGIEFWEIE